MGPFPIQDLHDHETKGTEPPQLPERDGLGGPQPRGRIMPRERVAWAESFYLGLSCANAATEVVSSRLLSQPFRVASITTAGNNTLASAATIAILAEPSDLAGVTAADLIARGLITGPFEGSEGAAQRYGPDNSHVHVGRIIRNVPTRLHLVVNNGSGGALVYAVTISVEFLTADEHTHDDSRSPALAYP